MKMNDRVKELELIKLINRIVDYSAEWRLRLRQEEKEIEKFLKLYERFRVVGEMSVKLTRTGAGRKRSLMD